MIFLKEVFKEPNEDEKMQTKVINLSEIAENNPTLCLSPLRVFNACHKCNHFLSRLQYYKRKYPDMSIDEMIERAIADIPCKPHVKKEYVELLKKKTKVLQELAEVQKKIDEL